MKCEAGIFRRKRPEKMIFGNKAHELHSSIERRKVEVLIIFAANYLVITASKICVKTREGCKT